MGEKINWVTRPTEEELKKEFDKKAEQESLFTAVSWLVGYILEDNNLFDDHEVRIHELEETMFEETED